MCTSRRRSRGRDEETGAYGTCETVHVVHSQEEGDGLYEAVRNEEQAVALVKKYATNITNLLGYHNSELIFLYYQYRQIPHLFLYFIWSYRVLKNTYTLDSVEQAVLQKSHLHA